MVPKTFTNVKEGSLGLNMDQLQKYHTWKFKQSWKKLLETFQNYPLELRV